MAYIIDIFIIKVVLSNKEFYYKDDIALCDNRNQAFRFSERAANLMIPQIKIGWNCKDVSIIKLN